MKRLWHMASEYRRLRRIAGGVSYGRIEAVGRAIANVEHARRFPSTTTKG